MGTSYPGALDALTNPTSSNTLDSPSHSDQHINANDAIEAIQAELGTDPAGSAATVKARLDNLPTGKMGTATRTSDQADIGATITDLTGLSVTVNVPDNTRLIRITGIAHFLASASEIAGLAIREGSTTFQQANTETNVTYGRTCVATVVLNPTSGLHTYKLSAISVTGAAFLTSKASATVPAVLIVEDIGKA